MTDTLYDVKYTFLIIFLSILLKMRNVSDKICRENKKTHFIISNFFSEICAFYEIMCKNMVELDSQQMKI
jgi:hypothetical protein